MAICERCGAWTEPPVLERDAAGALTLVCPHCQRRAPFAQRPLWWIAGSAGSGKSTLVPLLRRELTGYVVFEGEVVDFWRFDAPPADYASLYNQWLQIAWEIAQCDLPVILVATATPDQLDACTYRSRFAPLRYLGLVCDEATQAARLRAPRLARGRLAGGRRARLRLHAPPARTGAARRPPDRADGHGGRAAGRECGAHRGLGPGMSRRRLRHPRRAPRHRFRPAHSSGIAVHLE